MRDYRIGYDRFRGLDHARVVHGSVSALDTEARTLRIIRADGSAAEEPYDVLVIATGVANGFWRRPTVQDTVGRRRHRLGAPAHRSGGACPRELPTSYCSGSSPDKGLTVERGKAFVQFQENELAEWVGSKLPRRRGETPLQIRVQVVGVGD